MNTTTKQPRCWPYATDEQGMHSNLLAVVGLNANASDESLEWTARAITRGEIPNYADSNNEFIATWVRERPRGTEHVLQMLRSTRDALNAERSEG